MAGLLVVLVVVAVLAFMLSRRAQRRSADLQRNLGVWAETVVAADVDAPVLQEAAKHNRDIRTLPAVLVSERHGLVGKPDYVVVDGRFYQIVEKKQRLAHRLRESDRVQVWAYCLLLEENGYPTRGGEVQYANRTYPIVYGASERSRVVAILQDMRRWQQVFSTQQVPKREGPQCRNCKWRQNCAVE